MRMNKLAYGTHRIVPSAFAVVGCLALPVGAATSSNGDYTVNASGGEQGNLTVQGGASVNGNISTNGNVVAEGGVSGLGWMDYATSVANPGYPGVTLMYVPEEGNRAYTYLSDALSSVVWADNAAASPREKMVLDANNVLSLYNSTGSTASISLQGGTGQIHLTGTGSGIYSGGSAVFSLGAGGEVSYGSTRPVAIASTTASTSSTTGSLTVAGGIGVGGDSYISGLRIGRGNSGITSNLALGTNVLLANTTGFNNTGVGTQVLAANTTGYHNTALGNSALSSNSTGRSNTAVGRNALMVHSTGNYSTAVGESALSASVTGSFNTGIGYNALRSTTGNGNSGLGHGVMSSNTTGTFNSAMGLTALNFNTAGSYNVAVGYAAGNLLADGSQLLDTDYSVYLGYNARGYSNADTNSIVIGALAVGEGANTTVIGNSSTVSTHLYGETKANSLKVSGQTDLNNQVVVEAPVAPATAVRAMRVLADGTILVKPGGDLSMGGFTAGAQP